MGAVTATRACANHKLQNLRGQFESGSDHAQQTNEARSLIVNRRLVKSTASSTAVATDLAKKTPRVIYFTLWIPVKSSMNDYV